MNPPVKMIEHLGCRFIESDIDGVLMIHPDDWQEIVQGTMKGVRLQRAKSILIKNICPSNIEKQRHDK